MKYWKEIVILILILLIGSFYLLHTEKSNSAELKIKGLKADNRESAKRYDSLQAIQSIKEVKWHKDSLNMAIDNQKLTKDNARLQRRVAETRSVKEVQEAIDSIPQVAEAFNADDSLALGLKQQVDTLTNQLTRQADNYKAQLIISEAKNKELKGQLVNDEAVIEEQEKQLKKHKFVGKLKTIGIGVAFILWLAVGL
jgi:predicted RND superfamily exporter protein